jgi:uncharacterized protein
MRHTFCPMTIKNIDLAYNFGKILFFHGSNSQYSTGKRRSLQHVPSRMDYRAAKHHIFSILRRELSDKLTYHGLHHTRDVLRMAGEIAKAEGVSGSEYKLVKTAALFHDSGFLKNKHAGHEQEGCNLAANTLPLFGYNAEQIERICAMIMATKIPQSPQNLLEQIICDADLDYLGRDDFGKIGKSLFHELQAYQLIGDEQAWNRVQVSFLSAHRFHTKTSIARREPVKQRYLQELEHLVNSY